MKKKLHKAWELAMKGYSIEDIASSLMLIFNMRDYKKAREIASKGYWHSTPQGNEN